MIAAHSDKAVPTILITTLLLCIIYWSQAVPTARPPEPIVEPAASAEDPLDGSLLSTIPKELVEQLIGLPEIEQEARIVKFTTAPSTPAVASHAPIDTDEDGDAIGGNHSHIHEVDPEPAMTHKVVPPLTPSAPIAPIHPGDAADAGAEAVVAVRNDHAMHLTPMVRKMDALVAIQAQQTAVIMALLKRHEAAANTSNELQRVKMADDIKVRRMASLYIMRVIHTRREKLTRKAQHASLLIWRLSSGYPILKC